MGVALRVETNEKNIFPVKYDLVQNERPNEPRRHCTTTKADGRQKLYQLDMPSENTSSTE